MMMMGGYWLGCAFCVGFIVMRVYSQCPTQQVEPPTNVVLACRVCL